MTPYRPPNAGDGPLTIDKDLCWRINRESEDVVTPAVVSVVAWAFVHTHLTNAQKTELLNGLGLEWHEDRLGMSVLRPKHEFRP